MRLNNKQKEEVVEMYLNQLSTVQIAELMGVTHAAIRSLLKRRGVPLRSISQARRIRCKDPVTKKRSSEAKKKLWENPEYREKVTAAINQKKIAFNSNLDNINRIKGIIAGMMLGDGCLHIPKGGRNAKLLIQHTIKQREYIEYKSSILEEITEVRTNLIKPRGNKNPNWNIAVCSRTNPFYTDLFNTIYPSGKKVVSLNWLSWLTLEGLAIWYMDDGSLSKQRSFNKGGRYRVASRSVKLFTCGFSLEENEIIKVFLKERFDLEMKIYITSKLKGKTYYALRGSAKMANKLFDLIHPYILPCMMYKIDMEYHLPN